MATVALFISFCFVLSSTILFLWHRHPTVDSLLQLYVFPKIAPTFEHRRERTTNTNKFIHNTHTHTHTHSLSKAILWIRGTSFGWSFHSQQVLSASQLRVCLSIDTQRISFRPSTVSGLVIFEKATNRTKTQVSFSTPRQRIQPFNFYFIFYREFLGTPIRHLSDETE